MAEKADFAPNSEYSPFPSPKSPDPLLNNQEPSEYPLNTIFEDSNNDETTGSYTYVYGVSTLDRAAIREDRIKRARETRQSRRVNRLKEDTLRRQQQSPEENIEDLSDDSSVDENYDIASLADSIEEGGLTWRGRMQGVLHNHWVHLVIVILVVLDAGIVIFELLLDIGAFQNRDCRGLLPIDQAQQCHYDLPQICAPHAAMILQMINITPTPGHGSEELCRCGFRVGKFVCLTENEISGVNPGVVLHVFSLIILTCFLIEVILKIIAFKLKYFTHKFEVFDGMVVCISWTLDVASIAQEEAFEVASLLIILRLWRVIRVVNGAILTSKAQADNRYRSAKKITRNIVHAFHKAQDRMDKFEEENMHLKTELEKFKMFSTFSKVDHAPTGGIPNPRPLTVSFSGKDEVKFVEQ